MNMRIVEVNVESTTPTALVRLSNGSAFKIPIENPEWWGARIGKVIDLVPQDISFS